MESLNKNWLAILLITVIFFLLGYLVGKSCQPASKCKRKATAYHVEKGKNCGAIKAQRGGHHGKRLQESEAKFEE
jgi:hypothetical protein